MLLSQSLRRTVQNAVSGDGIADMPTLTAGAPTALELDTGLFNSPGTWLTFRATTFSNVTVSSYVPTMAGAASTERPAGVAVGTLNAKSVFFVTLGSSSSY